MPERARRRTTSQGRRWLRPLAVGLGVVAIGLVLWTLEPPAREKAREHPRGGHESGDRAGGSPPPVVAPRRRPRGVRLAGRVQTQEGVPIKGATVFVLPKASRGGTRDDLPHEVTDADGRWTLRAKQVLGCWIGAVAKGYMHAHLDGDRVDPAVQMVHVVREAPPLWVTLVDETGAPIPRKGVQLEPWPPAATYFLPGPGARQGERWAVSDEDGDLWFHIGSRGPVILRPQVEGYHVEGHPTWLPQPEGEVTLRFRRSHSLFVTLRAAQGGAPLGGLATADLYDPRDGRLALSFTEVVGEDGVLRIARGIRPGVYDLHVHVEEHGRAVLPALALRGEDPDEPHCVTVTLGQPEPAARLTLRMAPDAGGGRRVPATARRRAPLVYAWRDEPAWRNLRWQVGAPDSWDAASRTLVLPLPPGRYHVLVADVSSRCAALRRDVVLEAGVDLELAVALAPGLEAATRELELGNGRARTVSVTAGADLPLPVYGSARAGRVRVSRARDVLARAAEGEEVVLGPYPVTAVQVRVSDWEGTQREVEIRR